MNLINLQYKADGANRWVSDPVQMWVENASAEFILSTAGLVTLERSNAGDTYYKVPDFEMNQASGAFGITGGVNGQFIRIVTSVAPTKMSIII